MKELIVVFVILFVVVFAILTIIRIIMTLFLLYTIRKYRDLMRWVRPKDNMSTNVNPPSSRNDIMFRDKDIEKQKEREAKLQTVQRLPRVNEEEVNLDEKRIVGIVKPVGRWTAMILGQKVSYLMQHAETLKAQNSPNYWQNMIHAQDMARGKNKGRGV